MDRFIPVSDETGITLVGTYNAASAANPGVPYKWRIFYAIPGERRADPPGQRPDRAAALGDKLQHQALHYIAQHPLSPLMVAYDDTRRLFELEGTFAWHASAAAISLPISLARDGVLRFWVMCLLALAGAFSRPVRSGTEMGVARPAAARAQRGVRQRGDAALPRAGRPVPDPARGGGAHLRGRRVRARLGRPCASPG